MRGRRREHGFIASKIISGVPGSVTCFSNEKTSYFGLVDCSSCAFDAFGRIVKTIEKKKRNRIIKLQLNFD